MGFGFTLGKLILISALVMQGLYLVGVFPNTPLLNGMTKGLDALQKNFRLPAHAFHAAKENVKVVAQAIGGLILLIGFNIVADMKIILKLVILGEVILTLFIGVPWNLVLGKGTLLDTNDKNLAHMATNLAIIGGLIYWHACITKEKIEVPSNKDD